MFTGLTFVLPNFLNDWYILPSFLNNCYQKHYKEFLYKFQSLWSDTFKFVDIYQERNKTNEKNEKKEKEKRHNTTLF